MKEKNKAEVLKRKIFRKGNSILSEGMLGDCAYLIQSGRVSVYIGESPHEVELCQLEPGQIFGEMSLVNAEPRKASVRAVEDTNLIVIDRETFEKKLDRSDPTIRALVEMLTQRVNNGNSLLFSKEKYIADLEQASRGAYVSTRDDMPHDQKKVFEETVAPKLNAFLDAINQFRQG